jgi:hypothetical protein
MKNFKNYIPYLLIFFSLFTIVYAEDDDDNWVSELAFDLLIGAGMAICETSATCSSFMTIVAIFVTAILIVYTLCVCVCGSNEDRRGLCSSMPSGRRIAGTGAGYYATRHMLR